MASLINKIAVIGDSHTRAFALAPAFIPFFLGSGKKHCFINKKNQRRVFGKSVTLINHLKEDYDIKDYMLILGEPDLRWSLGKGWYPWSKKTINPLIYYRRYNLIDKSLDRYCTLLLFLKKLKINLIVFGATPVYEPELELASYWNACLSEFCLKTSMFFVDILSKIWVQDVGIIPKYRLDVVHPSPEIIPLVINEIRDFVTVSNFSKIESGENNAELRERFKYNEKFGSYILKSWGESELDQ